MAQEVNFSTIAFPDRPISHSNPYTEEFELLGLSKTAAQLAFAHDRGLLSLAREIWRIDATSDFLKNSPFSKNMDVWDRLLNVLTSMSREFIHVLLHHKLHTTIHKRNIALKMPKPYHPRGTLGDRLICYGLVLADKSGVTPTKNLYEEVLIMMRKYATHFDTPVDPSWTALDSIADAVDSAPGLLPNRDWASWEKGLWDEDSHGNKLPHPRRYCLNPTQRKKVLICVNELESRLKYISKGKRMSPVQWSPVYIGWTRHPDSRKISHYMHAQAGCVIRNLFEACMFVVAPIHGFFMHFIPIVNIADYRDASIAEHALSIMTSCLIHPHDRISQIYYLYFETGHYEYDNPPT